MILRFEDPQVKPFFPWLSNDYTEWLGYLGRQELVTHRLQGMQAHGHCRNTQHKV